MRGRAEHMGNRNYFGQERVDAAPRNVIHQQLKRIATLRKNSIALQKGLQLNVQLQGDTAIFYRVYENAGAAQTALVLLNKGDSEQRLEVRDFLQPGQWRDGFTSATLTVDDHLSTRVPPHDAQVYFYDRALTRADTRARLAELMANKEGK